MSLDEVLMIPGCEMMKIQGLMIEEDERSIPQSHQPLPANDQPLLQGAWSPESLDSEESFDVEE